MTHLTHETLILKFYSILNCLFHRHRTLAFPPLPYTLQPYPLKALCDAITITQTVGSLIGSQTKVDRSARGMSDQKKST